MFPNYYQRLGLSRQATKEEIKKAYRKLALEFHPDRNKSPDAHEKFIAINEAYLILYDDEARQKYDIEYDFHFGKKSDFKQEENEKEQFKQKPYEESFEDADLNDWSSKARKQGAEYAKMAFDDFSKLVIGFVKETGFQLGNTLLVFFGIVLTMGGCGNLVIGLSTSGEIGNPVVGIILLPIGILLWRAANKNWESHDK
jgi:curved DNA-binding protein CbpA